MDDPLNTILTEIKMFWKIIASSIPFIVFGIMEDSVMFQLGRITTMPFWLAVLAVIIPLSIVFAYLQLRVFKSKTICK